MKIQFLGTSASPSVPIPFCQCKVCTEAKKVRGKNLRKRSSIKINHDMLIDIGPDIMNASNEYNIDLSDITICLQTHFHEDHFDPELIISRHSEYGTVLSNDLLLVGSQQTLEKMDEIIGRRCSYGSIFETKVQESLRIRIMPITFYKEYIIGDYAVTGYPANHGSATDGCTLYKVEYKNRSLFYGADTSIFFDEVWDNLRKSEAKFDLVILDHTYGLGYESGHGDHLASKDFIEHVQKFKIEKMIKKNGQIYATHISHEGTLEYNEFENFATENGYHIAYDGLVIEPLDEMP